MPDHHTKGLVMKKWIMVLFLLTALTSFNGCLGEDTSDTDGDSTETDGDTSTDGDTETDGDLATDGDTGTDGDTATDGDSTDGDDPFSGLDCESKTQACNLWYCNAQKLYDNLYAKCAGDHYGITEEQCAAYIVCADAFKVCIAQYRSLCVGDSVPAQLATECTMDVSSCEQDVM